METAAQIAARFLGKDNRDELERAILRHMDFHINSEREACARIAESGADFALPQMAELQRSIARAIRSRVEV